MISSRHHFVRTRASRPPTRPPPVVMTSKAGAIDAAYLSSDDASKRMRRRHFLGEVQRIKARQSGVTEHHKKILEGVYELEPRPPARTEARLARQLDLDVVAVSTWFRTRRRVDKRRDMRFVGILFFLIVFAVLLAVYWRVLCHTGPDTTALAW